MYKKSVFNILTEREGDTYIWNTYTGALAKLNGEYVAAYSEGSFDESAQTTKDFLKQGYIVPSRCNEIQRLLHKEKATICDPHPKGHSFIIAPSMACNYNCVYCFEDGFRTGGNMSESTKRKTVDYIESVIDQNGSCEYLYITWFGGEPLLQVDAITTMSEDLIEICRQRNMRYIASVITNGRLLTEEVFVHLRSLNLEYLQITIDGMPDVYCANKGASEEDFYAVIDNLERACEDMVVSLRINTDLSNKKSVLTLIDYLFSRESIRRNALLHLANIDNFHADHDCESYRFGFDNLAFTREIDLYLKENYGSRIRYTNFVLNKPCPCKFARSTNGCIAPDGSIYRCAEQINKGNYIVGTVEDGLFFNETERSFSEFSHEEKCLSCAVLPICMGYCTRDVIEKRGNIQCEAFINHAIEARLLSALSEEEQKDELRKA